MNALRSVSRPVPLAAPLPYGRQTIEEDDIDAVVEALRGDYLTTGPFVTRFEEALASRIGARETVACANGTAALYMAARALDLGPESTVIVPAIAFVACTRKMSVRPVNGPDSQFRPPQPGP